MVDFFGHHFQINIWHKSKTAYRPKSTIVKVKHGGGNIVLKGYYSAGLWGSGPERGLIDNSEY